MRLCLDRFPPRKERTIQLDGKPLENTHDLSITFQDVVTAVAEGRITPGEGQALAHILTAHAQNLQANDLARRGQEMESHLDEIRRYRQERERSLQEVVRES